MAAQQEFDKIHSLWLDQLDRQRDTDLTPEEVAATIKKLWGRYIAARQGDVDVWSTPRETEAYLSYYLPLNWLRLSAIFSEGLRLGFFTDLNFVVDMGSGPGTAHLAASELKLQFADWALVDTHKEAHLAHQSLAKHLKLDTQSIGYAQSPPSSLQANTLVLFSYSLNEMQKLPLWALDAEALMIAEPSTMDFGRNLQGLRETLIKAGFHLWAPCTHHEGCPLLLHSKTDWCHQRVHVELPKRLQEIERHLPNKNKTLTFSYLLAKRIPPPKMTKARVIGDTQYERGKVKQSVCRSAKREFLTWLTRYGDPAPIQRGSLIDIPEAAVVKGDELRMPAEKL